MTKPIRLILVGIGKIARDQHLPTIAGNPDVALVATVSRHSALEGVPNFASLTEAMAGLPGGADAAVLCTPPLGRLALVQEALAAGLDLMLEKPPAASVTEAEAIVAAVAAAGKLIYLTWHSRDAAAVAPAGAWLSERAIRHVAVSWKEDVRVWHPGQEWIWAPGIGVFDPGINALSVITRLLPGPLLVEQAALAFPANKPAPIAAELSLVGQGGLPVAVSFDFDQRGPQGWDIVIETDGGELRLGEGASRWFVDGAEQATSGEPEYAGLYRRFVELIAAGGSDADLSPFRLVADCFQVARRDTVAAFDWTD
jgi:D-galactose 1-dehydrogenase